jgi:hypothetical protein
MPPETRSLWEIYDSEVEPWRRGRTALICIALVNLLFQALHLAAGIILGYIEGVFIFAAACVLFWFLFYFIWIGVHWIRWVAGAWSGINGFCFVIWSIRDENILLGAVGAINLLIASYFCLSSSVYFFAKRQREKVRGREAIGIAAVCLLILASIGAAMFAVWGLRVRELHEAGEFVATAAQRVYVESDLDWALTHVTPESLQSNGLTRLKFFLEDIKQKLPATRQISDVSGKMEVRFQFPADFHWQANATCHAESDKGPARLHFVISNTGADWQIEHMWWEYLPLP